MPCNIMPTYIDRRRGVACEMQFSVLLLLLLLCTCNDSFLEKVLVFL